MAGSVYLAGPITGLTWNEAVGWREYVASVLRSDGITCWSPLRGKDFLQSVGRIADSYPGVHPLSSPAGIVARDRWDVQRADVVLANLTGTKRASIGTILELAWADSARVPVVGVWEEGNVHDHAMIRQIVPYVVRDLDHGLEVVRSLLLEGR
jgi:nucleoside 2-deoxyribosyltransferase